MTEARKRKRGGAGAILWSVAALIVLGVAALIVLLALRPPEESEDTAELPVPVRIRVLEPRAVHDRIELPGRVEAWVDAVLAAEQPGRVTAIEADKGDRVAAGTVLARLDDRMWAAALRRAEATLREAERDCTRLEALSRTGAVADQDLDAVRLRRDLAAVTRDEAEIGLSRCTIRAPIDGRIDDRRIEEGEFAREGQAVFRLIATARVKLVFDMPERDILSVAPGRVVQAVFDPLPGQSVTGTVCFVAAAADPHSNTFRVEAEVDNGDGTLRPGMLARVSLPGRARDAFVVPLEAVVPHRGDHVVFLAQDDRAVRRVVLLDRLLTSEAVIADGVRAGERLIVDGHRGLTDGAAIRVRD
jgi:membrane fusion protein, multidrug efflux system